jgi:hypothetical protein
MTTRHADLVAAEHDQQVLESGLVELEAEVAGHEARLLEQLDQFEDRNGALLAFSDYVRDEEQALLRRAEGLGPPAVVRVREALATTDATTPLTVSPPDLAASRLELLARRRELYAMRVELLEAREQLHAACVDHFEALQRDVAGLEASLVRRQQALGAAARAVFMGAGGPAASRHDGASAPGRASAPSGPLSRSQPRVDPGPSTAVHPDPVTSRVARMLAASDEPPRAGAAPSDLAAPEGAALTAEPAGASLPRDYPAVRTEGPIEVAPELAIVALRPASAGLATPSDPRSPSDGARPRPLLAPLRVPLDAALDGGAWLYRDAGAGPDDLPGVFIPTPNLLKVDRDVVVRLNRRGERLEVNARVRWRVSEDPPGMGLLMTDVSAEARAVLARWTSEEPPRAIVR